MNKIVASLGLVAVGASSVQSVNAADELNAPASKLWNVSASLRAFYDDNINTAPDGANQVESFGFALTPGFDLNWAGEATSARAGYRFSFLWYDKDFANTTDNTSMTHTFNGALTHSFSERYQLSIVDSFVLGQ